MTNDGFWQPQRRLLAANYLFYFAMQALTVPFMAVFLKLRGFSAPDIGTLMAAQMAIAMIAPYWWASLADRYGRRTLMTKLGVALSLLGVAGLLLAEGFWPTAAALLLFGFSWSGILAQLEVLTLSALRPHVERYSRIRTWGSVGFLVMVVLAGWLFERWSVVLMPWVGCGLLLVMLVFSLPLRCVEEASHRVLAESWSGINWLRVGTFVLFAFCLNASHGAFFGFYVLYLQSLGISEGVAGVLVASGVVAEVALFALTPRLLRRVSLEWLMIACGMLALVRWYLTAEMTSPWGQLPANLLHAASFSLAHVCAMQFIHHEFRPGIQGRVQALYRSLSFSGGSALGVYFSGQLWQRHPEQIWWLAMGLATVALLVALGFKGLHDNKRMESRGDH
ncbi:MFS transporter, PPP family, 3-phenylpropionic acid transporter [Ferrimonas sediminum]|uniref:MFS transporter, PPP family, 3-phenylpropionic acid transporter n=1 Tax=Ferrimonas sediminum TaxID=718193 RepID=A0A1G8XV53_9GAMM|nr:MFS transporter [Ferrimonas sediminum]SDJ94418.1 MFS transporter, PPP family, 3-phenylpropionic acid transporter [Ferrimonas sediminum]